MLRQPGDRTVGFVSLRMWKTVLPMPPYAHGLDTQETRTKAENCEILPGLMSGSVFHRTINDSGHAAS